MTEHEARVELEEHYDRTVSLEADREIILGLEASLSVQAFDYTKDKVQHSNKNVTEDRLAKYADAVTKYIKKHDEWWQKSWKIADKIMQIDDHRYKLILYRRYFRCWEYKVIADEMKYTERQIYRLKIEAIKAYAEIKVVS